MKAWYLLKCMRRWRGVSPVFTETIYYRLRERRILDINIVCEVAEYFDGDADNACREPKTSRLEFPAVEAMGRLGPSPRASYEGAGGVTAS